MRRSVCILAMLLLFGCSKPEAKDTSMETIINDIRTSINISNYTQEDLTDQKNAEKYGISSEIIKEGYALYSNDKSLSDKIILVRAAKDEDIDILEEALSAQKMISSTAWGENEDEFEKVKDGVLMTKGDCILLAISDDAKEIKEIFSKNL